MKNKMKWTLGFLWPLLLAGTLLPGRQEGRKADDLNDRIREKSGLAVSLDDRGWEWNEAEWRGNADKGEIAISDGKWLMYLIHWGPIQTEAVTEEYVRRRMLGMWGVDFEFTGISGPTNMAGHDAWFVEAYGTRRRFYTRFIVWNCPESGREFIADTNYNLVTRTPQSDFAEERRSAQTIRCHPQAAVTRSPGLNVEFPDTRYGFSFFHPERWFFSDSPYYVPYPEYEGIRGPGTGSLLGLCSDENLRVILSWEPLPEEETKGTFLGADMNAIRSLTTRLKGRSDLGEFQAHGTERFQVDGRAIDRTWGAYAYPVQKDKPETEMYTGSGIFQAARWDLPEAGKRLTVILLTKAYEDHGVSSQPVRETLDRFLRELIGSVQAPSKKLP